jgi:hypothetical protein
MWGMDRGFPEGLTVRPGNHGLTSAWQLARLFLHLRALPSSAPDQCMADDAAPTSGQTTSNTEGGTEVRPRAISTC